MLNNPWSVIVAGNTAYVSERAVAGGLAFEILDVSFDVPLSERIFSFQELEKGN